MRPSSMKRKWSGYGVVVFVSVFAIVGVLMLFRPLAKRETPINPETIPMIGVSRIGAEASDALFSERIEMLDPTPLFLPTRWNTSQQPLPWDVAKRPGASFDPFNAKMVFDGRTPGFAFHSQPYIPEASLDALKRPSTDPFFSFGRVDAQARPLPFRAACFEVVDAKTGAKCATEKLKEIAQSEAWRDWAPVEYVVVVDAAGLVAEPLIKRGSGLAEVDTFFQEYLAKHYWVGSRLSPGTYNVIVGP